MMTDSALTFVVVLAGFGLGHHVGDRYLQTGHQAITKGTPGMAGWRAAAGHVATYTLATAAVTLLLWPVFALPVTPAGFLLGQAVSAGSHLIIDRRYTLRAAIAAWDRLVPGKLSYYDDVPGAAEHLDQVAHAVFLFTAALITALV